MVGGGGGVKGTVVTAGGGVPVVTGDGKAVLRVVMSV